MKRKMAKKSSNLGKEEKYTFILEERYLFFILIVARGEPDALRIVATTAAVRSHATCSLGGTSSEYI